jgi:uncharacterized protein YjdB
MLRLKRVFIVLFLIINSLASAKTYYVAPIGSNSNPGTITRPWLAWSKAFTTAVAGDTVYFREGVYYVTGTGTYASISHSGSSGNPICFFNYPGEEPILDCSGIISTTYTYAIRALQNKNYIEIKGLTVRNLYQAHFNDYVQAIAIEESHHVKLENMKVHTIGGVAFGVAGCNEVYVKNCDAWNLCDTLHAHPGQNGDGFQCITSRELFGDSMYDAKIYFEGCRVWDYGDNGFAALGVGYVEFKNCWSFNGGQLDGEGCAWKLDNDFNSSDLVNPLCRVVINCIAADNGFYGFSPSNLGSSTYNGHYYNNFSYHNGYKHDLLSYKDYFGVGFMIFNYIGSTPAPNERYANNIAYDNEYRNVYSQDNYIHQYNSWDQSVTVTDADFLSLDVDELKGSRKADGSLPDINFGKLAAGSDLIDAGTNVGLPYLDTAPDLGAFEYSGTTSNPKPITNVIVTGTEGATTITSNKGTLQLSAAVLPSDAANKTVIWSVTNSTGQATISSLGLVTAVANGAVAVRATANDGSGVYGTLVITISNQAVPVTGITVIGSGGASTITTTGGTLQMSVSVLPSNATNNSVTWSIANGTGQATISSAGLVKAVSNGTVTVIATGNDGSGVYGTFTITITNQVIAVTSITVTGAGGASTIATDGGTLQLSAAVLPTNASNKTITWSITNGSGLASINSSTGLVTATDNGTVTVRATANDGSGIYGTVVLTISNQSMPVSSITVTGAGGASTITTDGGTLQLSAAVLPANATDKTVTWSVTSGSGLASINSSTGLVTATDNGTVTVRATANDGSGIYGTLVLTILNRITTVNPDYIGSVIENDAPSLLKMTYSLSLANIQPDVSAFNVIVNSLARNITSVSIQGTTVILTLASPVIYNDSITVDYIKPDVNPLQSTSGGQAAVLTSQPVTNNVSIDTNTGILNEPPVILVNYKSSSYSGFISEIDAKGSYDTNKDNLTFTWIIPNNIPVSSTTGSSIKYLGPIVNSTQTVVFTLRISDGKTTQSKVIPVEIIPYKPELEVAEMTNIEASSYHIPYYPYNVVDGNIGTKWSSDGNDQWLIVELKQSFDIQHVKLAFQPGEERESYFDILGSEDKVNWEPILVKFASCSFSSDLQVFEFPPSKTEKEFKYVKLIGRGNSVDTWNNISELKIFGHRFKNNPVYEKLPVKIYPNPAKEFITLRIDEPSFVPDLIQILNLSGSIVFRNKLDRDNKEITIPIHLTNGVYIVQLESDKMTIFAQKLIVFD